MLFLGDFSIVDFCLTHLAFCPQKRNKQVAPSGHYLLLELRAFQFTSLQVCDSQTVLETYWFEGRFFEVDSPPRPSISAPIPTPAHY